MEELNILTELFKNLANEDVKFNMVYVDKDGKKQEFNLNTQPNQCKKKDMSIGHSECAGEQGGKTCDDLRKLIEIKDKYIEQLVARIDKNNQEKVEQQRKIEQNKEQYIALCEHMKDSILNIVGDFDVLIHLLGFEKEAFYNDFNNILNYHVKC